MEKHNTKICKNQSSKITEQIIDEPLVIVQYIRQQKILNHFFKNLKDEEILFILNSRFRNLLASVPVTLFGEISLLTVQDENENLLPTEWTESKNETSKDALIKHLGILNMLINCYQPKTKGHFN